VRQQPSEAEVPSYIDLDALEAEYDRVLEELQALEADAELLAVVLEKGVG